MADVLYQTHTRIRMYFFVLPYKIFVLDLDGNDGCRLVRIVSVEFKGFIRSSNMFV